MAESGPEYGTFQNGIPYVRRGNGQKDLVVFYGGPGNNLPHGPGSGMVTRGFEPLLDRYTLHLVSRKSGLPEGCTTRDLSDDYAELISREFGGHVDLVVGMSFGGMIAQHFAADHAGLFDHIVIAMAAHRISGVGKRIDFRYADLLSRGQPRRAMAVLAEVMFPGRVLRPLGAAFLWLVGPGLLGSPDETFRRDIMIEAEAEFDHEALDSLRRIEVPVLVLCGDRDLYFPLEYVTEMVDLLPGATLKVYPGKGHDILSDRRVARDISEFVGGAA